MVRQAHQPGKRDIGSCSKLFNLFGLVGYFRRAALGLVAFLGNSKKFTPVSVFGQYISTPKAPTGVERQQLSMAVLKQTEGERLINWEGCTNAQP